MNLSPTQGHSFKTGRGDCFMYYIKIYIESSQNKETKNMFLKENTIKPQKNLNKMEIKNLSDKELK